MRDQNRPARPPLRHWTAVVQHRPHPSADAVVRQLERLGLKVRQAWPELGPDDVAADIVFFDADMAFDGMFPWAAGEAPMPLVALIGSEAPGRVEWALRQGSNAHLLKPITSAGVYSAMLIASHAFEQTRTLRMTVRDLRDRMRQRPAVARAVLALMRREDLDEVAAMRRLRSLAMDRRTTVEVIAAELAAADGGADVARG
jgi:AmiR/NasT family two-component response regulator